MVFPQFDNMVFFKKTLAALTPLGFEDYSSPDDACPSLGLAVTNNILIQVFIDHISPEYRHGFDDVNVYMMAFDSMGDQIVEPETSTSFKVEDVMAGVAKILATLRT